jgi:hypothetical protein
LTVSDYLVQSRTPFRGHDVQISRQVLQTAEKARGFFNLLSAKDLSG